MATDYCDVTARMYTCSLNASGGKLADTLFFLSYLYKFLTAFDFSDD